MAEGKVHVEIVYRVDGKKLYDRKEPGAVDFLPALKEIHKIRDAIREVFDAAPPAAAH